MRIASALLALLACATALNAQSAPAAPARQATTIQPGVYDLQITFGGGVLDGVLTVTAPRRDSLAVTLLVMGHESPVAATGHQGNKLVLDSTSPGQNIHYDLEFRGETVTGPFTYGDGSGTVTGRRRAGR